MAKKYYIEAKAFFDGKEFYALQKSYNSLQEMHAAYKPFALREVIFKAAQKMHKCDLITGDSDHPFGYRTGAGNTMSGLGGMKIPNLYDFAQMLEFSTVRLENQHMFWKDDPSIAKQYNYDERLWLQSNDKRMHREGLYKEHATLYLKRESLQKMAYTSRPSYRNTYYYICCYVIDGGKKKYIKHWNLQYYEDEIDTPKNLESYFIEQ